MRLKDMTQILSTTQPIRIIYPNNESHIAKLEEFTTCEKYIVTDIYCKNGELNIKIEKPYGNSYIHSEENVKEIMINLLKYLVRNHPKQIAEIVGNSDVELEYLKNIFEYMGFSVEILDEYNIKL